MKRISLQLRKGFFHSVGLIPADLMPLGSVHRVIGQLPAYKRIMCYGHHLARKKAFHTRRRGYEWHSLTLPRLRARSTQKNLMWFCTSSGIGGVASFLHQTWFCTVFGTFDCATMSCDGVMTWRHKFWRSGMSWWHHHMMISCIASCWWRRQSLFVLVFMM